MDKIKLKWKFGWIVLYVTIILMAASFLWSYTYIDSEQLFFTPVFTDNRGWEIYKLENDVRKDMTAQELYDSAGDGQTVYLSRILDEEIEQEGYTELELNAVGWRSSVFLDGELLYTVAPELDNRIGFIKFPEESPKIQREGEDVRVTLPPDYGGKELTIACSFDSGMDYKFMPMVRMSSEKIQTKMTVANTNRVSIPAAIYMTVAIILLGLFFHNLYYGIRSYSVLLLMAAALMQALRVLLNFDLNFIADYSLDFIGTELLIPLSFSMPMLYLLAQMKRWRKWYAPFLLIPLILSVGLHIIIRLGVMAFLSAYAYDAMLYVSLLALILFCVLEWKDKNPVYRMFTPALFVVIAGMLIMAVYLALYGRDDSMFVYTLRSPLMMCYNALQLYGSILLILSGAVSFILTVRKASDTQSELSVLSVKNELITENIQSIQKSSTEIAKMRHDMLRHLRTMLDLSHEGNNERLENYLTELTEETESILPLQVCRHPIVNALVTRALHKAEKENIRLDVRVEVPAQIPVADTDLCTLLMNMLDNAIEAVSLLPEGKERSIELTMHIRGRYLFVETLNPCVEKLQIDGKTGLYASGKGEGHGYGMKAMSDIARKYNSMLQIKQEHGTVMIRTALLLPQKE